jgi:hypothetical protein
MGTVMVELVGSMLCSPFRRMSLEHENGACLSILREKMAPFPTRTNIMSLGRTMFTDRPACSCEPPNALLTLLY